MRGKSDGAVIGMPTRRGRPRLGRALIICLAALLFSSDALAAAYFSVAGGAWNTNNRWRTGAGASCAGGGALAGAAYPGSTNTADTATICNSHAVTLNLSPAFAIASLTIGSTCANNTSLASSTTNVALTTSSVSVACANSTLSFNGASGSFTLTVNGNLTNSGIVSTTNSVNVHTLNVSGDITTTGGTFDLRVSATRYTTLNLTGAGTQTVSGTTAMDLNDINAASATNNLTVNKSAGNMNVGGDVNSAGSLTITAGTFQITGASAAQTLVFGGDITNAGTIALTSNSRTHTMSVGGNIANNGTGVFDLRLDANDRVDLTFTGASGTTHTISGTSTGTTEFWNVTTSAGNNLIVNKTAGATVTQTHDLTVNGNLTISSGTVTLSGSDGVQALSVTGNLSNSGTVTMANVTATHTLAVGGDFTNDGTFTFILDANTLLNTTFNGTVAQAIGGSSTTTFNNLTISNNNSPATAVSVNSSINVGNATSASTTLNMNGANTVLTPAAGVIINTSSTQGTITGSGTINVTRVAATADYVNQYKFTTNTLSGLTVNYSGAGAQTINATATVGSYGNLIASNSGTKTLGGAVTVNGDLTVSTTNVTLDLSTFTADRAGAGGTITVVNGSTLKIGGTNTFPANYSTRTLGATSTVDYNGANQNVSNLGGQNYGHLTVEGSGTKTLTGGNANVAGDLTVNASGVTFDLGSNTADRTSSGGTITVVNGASLKIGGTNGFPANYSSGALGATSTVEYYGSAQTVGGQNYGHLTLSGSGTKTLGGTATVKGNLTANTSGVTFDLGSNTCAASGGVATITVGNGVTLKIGGTNTFPSGYLTTTLGASSTVEYYGSAQNVAALGYANLTIGGSGTKTLSGDASASATLTLNNGVVSTGGNSLSVGAAGTVSRCASTTECFVAGNLVRGVASGGSPTLVWDIGVIAPSAAYTPVTLALSTVTVAGTVKVTTTNGDHPNVGTSQLDSSKSVNRYWTVTNTGVTYTSVDATFGFVSGDVDGGASTSNFAIGKYSSGDWSYPDVGTAGSTSTQALTILFADGFGDFEAAEPATANPLSIWHMDQQSWNGTANEVTDSGSGAYHGQAASLSTTKPTTSMASSAISGNPGTCQYGVFNRANKDYVALPSGFPNLGTSTSFTVTAWIRTTDNTQAGQRVFADDENNTQGFALSLGDPGTGRLRFFSRGTSTISLDDSNVLANNTWYFIAITADITLKRKRIYVYQPGTGWLTGSTQTWTTTFGTGDAGPPSIGGETNASGEGTSSFGFAGNIDEARVYQVALGKAHLDLIRQLTQPCNTLNHFAISHDGTAVNCEAENITIGAHLTDHSLLASYTGTITLSTSTNHGDWSVVTAGGTLNNGTADDGQATYTFVAGDGGDVVLALKDTHPETVNFGVADGSITETSGTALASEDQDLVFSATGFNFLADGVAGAIGTQIAGKPSDTAPGNQTLKIKAVKTDDQTGACTSALNAATTIQMKVAWIDPGSNGSPVDITGTSIVSVSTSYTNVTLDFGTTPGEAPFTLKYPNAGQIRLDAQYDIPLSGGGASGNLMQGSSNSFVVRPFGFYLSISGNPGAADANGSVFKKAGENFTVGVSAVAWQSADDVDTDGAPDSGADLSDNAVTANFGNEATPETATISRTLIAPIGGSGGTLTGGGPISVTNGGPVNATLSWSEVGIIRLDAALSNSPYLTSSSNVTGSSRKAGNTNGNVGRFKPARFNVAANTPEFQYACGSGAGAFTYMDEPFYYVSSPSAKAPVLTVTAINVGGATTTNYGDTFWKLNSTLANRSYAEQNGHALDVVDGSNATLGGTSDFDGIGTLTLTAGNSGGDAFSYTRAAVPVAPFNAAIRMTATSGDLTDDDGACYDGDNNGSCDNFTISDITFTGSGTKQLRFGRLAIGTVAGSELLSLAVPLNTQYFDGPGFVQNSDDTCTKVGAQDPGDASEPFLSLTSAVEAGQSDGDVDVSNAGTCTGPGVTTATVAHDPFAGGSGGLSFSAPGEGCTGYARITTDLGAPGPDWLRYDWDGNGTHDNDPTGRAEFGVYRGQDQLIYRREPWN